MQNAELRIISAMPKFTINHMKICGTQINHNSSFITHHSAFFDSPRLSKLVSLNFTADGLWKLIAEYNDSRIFIRSGVLLYVVLNFLL